MIRTPFVNYAGPVINWRVVLPSFAVLWGSYLVMLQPWLMNWGATGAEVGMSLPGDDPGLSPSAYFTRAITIEAPPAVVW